MIAWAREVGGTTALVISHWIRVGFVHGVMNTDNMSIHGLTIDAAEQGDFSVCEALHSLLEKPYEEQVAMEEEWFQRRPEWARNRVGCSMLSCSS